MKVNHYKRRKYWKKLRRKYKRIEKAQLLVEENVANHDVADVNVEINIEELKWIAREQESQELWKLKQQKLKEIQQACDISCINPTKEKTKKASVNYSHKKLTRVDLPYRNPDLPHDNRESDQGIREVCQFYRKTGTCRFDFRCSRVHESPIVSDTILFLNMFTACSSDFVVIPGDSDASLEYDEKEFLNEYDEFYNDVQLELASYGRIVTIRTCRNVMKHLRGNVYVQYRNINDAVYALSDLNGRYFAGRPLSGRFVTIESWRESICGLYHRGKCPKGAICNFLHVLLNPDESTHSLIRFLNRSVHQDTRIRSRRLRSDSSTCSSLDRDMTPDRESNADIYEKNNAAERKKKSKKYRERERSRSRSVDHDRHRRRRSDNERTERHKERHSGGGGDRDNDIRSRHSHTSSSSRRRRK